MQSDDHNAQPSRSPVVPTGWSSSGDNDDFLTFIADDERATDRLGEAFANVDAPRVVAGLIGTLGAGKTRFVQAIAAGLGIPRSQIVSPTFVLCQEYHGRRTVYHLDAYRIRDDDEFLQLGVEELFDAPAWTFVEWSDRVADCLPEDWLEIVIELTDDDARQFRFRPHGPAANEFVRRLRQTEAFARSKTDDA